MSSGGNTCNQHSLDNTMRISLHHASIHKCSRISLVTVTYHIFYFRILCQNLSPFSSGWEAAASTPTERCLRNFIYYLLWCHIEQSLCNGTVTAHRYVLFDRFRIDTSAILQRHTGLLFVERNLFLFFVSHTLLVMINQSLDDTVIYDTLFNNLFTVFYFYFDI